MQSWKLRRQGNKTLKNRLSEEGLGKKEELCCCCVACSVSVVPCVWPQSEGMVVFSLSASVDEAAGEQNETFCRKAKCVVFWDCRSPGLEQRCPVPGSLVHEGCGDLGGAVWP